MRESDHLLLQMEFFSFFTENRARIFRKEADYEAFERILAEGLARLATIRIVSITRGT